jgi:DNA-binding NtrC family response regulator
MSPLIADILTCSRIEYMDSTIFIVTRKETFLDTIESWGKLGGSVPITWESLEQAYSQLPVYEPVLLLVDRRETPESILSLLRKIRRRYPHLEIMLLESPRSPRVRQAEAQVGVDRFLDLPLSDKDLKMLLGRRIDLINFRRGSGIIGKSEALEQILEMIIHIAPTDISVLITGESGTGKELIARIIHKNSRRLGKAFLALNCGALPEGTLESELFGHEKGAFTGATGTHAGHFERADSGTLFLDEIGELSPQIQIRLLRVLETGEYIRMGGVGTRKANVRLLAATNKDLDLEVRKGNFRRDLLHRIKVIEVAIPPLREREEDIPILVDHFIREIHEKEGTPLLEVSPELMGLFRQANWLGNVRELRNTIHRMSILARGHRLEITDLPPDFIRDEPVGGDNLPVPVNLATEDAERELIYRSILALREDVRQVLDMLHGFEKQMRGEGDQTGGLEPEVIAMGRDLSDREPLGSIGEMEKQLITRILDENAGHRKRAARQLGISERTLYRKLKEYDLG